MSDLSSVLAASKDLTSHVNKPDLPSVHLSLDQIEAQSRRLVSKYRTGDTDKANYLLAQASIDSSALTQSIAHLNTTFTSSSLQPLQDTDVNGFLRHAHEQNIVKTIEEGRRETTEDFYLMLEERTNQEWEAKKKRVFDELGVRVAGRPASNKVVNTTSAPLSLQMHTKMLAYDRTITALNAARLRGTSYPLIHALMSTASSQYAFMFSVLAKITQEPPALPPIEHSGAHILNAPQFERKYAKAYLSSTLGPQIAKGARQALEEQYLDIIQRTVQSHPTQAQLGGDPSISNLVRAFCAVRFYRGGEWHTGGELVSGVPLWPWVFFLVRIGQVTDALRVLNDRRDAVEAKDPGFIDAFSIWSESRTVPKPVKTHLANVYPHQSQDPFKLALYKLIARLDVGRRSVPNVTNTTEDWLWFQFAMVDDAEELNSLTTVLLAYGERHFGAPLWPSVLVMCGQFERAVASLWDHPDTQVEAVHLAIALAYHGLLRVSSKAETTELGVLTLSPPSSTPSLALPTLIWRYVRQFVKMDPKEALQYVYTLPLSSDSHSLIGQEQLEAAWELVRRIIVLGNSGPNTNGSNTTNSGLAWEELVGGVKPDGTRFPGVLQNHLPLLHLSSSSPSSNFPSSQTQTHSYTTTILLPTASLLLSNDRLPEAIKLYDLSGEYDLVVGCLADALGRVVVNLGSFGSGGTSSGSSGYANANGSSEDGRTRDRELEKTAREILGVYERLGRGTGLSSSTSTSSSNANAPKNRLACIQLLKILDAAERGKEGQVERALEVLEGTGLIPIDEGVVGTGSAAPASSSGARGSGDLDVVKITRKAEEFSSLHEAVQRCLPVYMVLCMDALVGVTQKVKGGGGGGFHASSQHHLSVTIALLRKKSRAVMVYAGLLKYRMSPEVYGYLARGDVEVAL